MDTLQVYKMEMYKMVKRKSSWMLLLPCLLAVLISLGMGSGNVTVTQAGGSPLEALSCIDFFLSVWNLLSGFGIIGILVIITASLQFSGEIERGQIKTSLLRVGKRSQVILAKLFVMISVVAMLTVVLAITLICCYYFIVVPEGLGNGAFSLSVSGLTNLKVFGIVLCWAANYIILIAAAFLAGTLFGPFATFIITLILMFGEKYLVTMGSLKIFRYLPEGFVNGLLTGVAMNVWDIILFAACTFGITGVMIMMAINIFRKQDI